MSNLLKLYDQVTNPGASENLVGSNYQEEIDAGQGTGFGENFASGVRMGVDQTQGLGYGLLAFAGDVFGSKSLEKVGMEGYQRNMREAQAEAPRVQSVTQISNLRDFIDWSAGAFGQAIPSLATSLAGGGAGGLLAKTAVKKGITRKFAYEEMERDLGEQATKELVRRGVPKETAKKYIQKVTSDPAQLEKIKGLTSQWMGQNGLKAGMAGAYAVSGPMGVSEVYTELRDNGIEAPGTALGIGAISGALDIIPEAVLAGGLVKKALGQEIKKTAKQAGGDSLLKTLGINIAKQAPLEGATEGAQEYLQLVARAIEDPAFKVNERENWMRVMDAAAAGAVVGVFTGGGGGVIDWALNKGRGAQDDTDQKDKPQTNRGTSSTGTSPRVSEGDTVLNARLEPIRAKLREMGDPATARNGVFVSDLPGPRGETSEVSDLQGTALWAEITEKYGLSKVNDPANNLSGWLILPSMADVVAARREVEAGKPWTDVIRSRIGQEQSAPAAPSSVPDTPSAEPLAALKAQVDAVNNPQDPKQAVLFPVDNAQDMAAVTGNQGASMQIPGTGVLWFADPQLAQQATAELQAGTDPQLVIGKYTGSSEPNAETKQANATVVVNRKDAQGNTIETTATTPDNVATVAASKEGKLQPGQTVQVTTPEEELAKRREGIAAERNIKSVTFDNGVKYVGEVKNNKPHGQGTYTYPDGEGYVGEFRDGTANGQGTFTYPDGSKYVGEWKDGKTHGQGTFTYSDGSKYVGEYKDGKRHGQGTYIYPDGEGYVGEYKDGNEHGQGTYTWPDGSKYVGEWKDGNEHGQGTYTWPDGRKYVGEWKDGNEHGQGTYTLPDGSKYVGEWKDGNEHGQSTYTLPDGTEEIRVYKNGELISREKINQSKLKGERITPRLSDASSTDAMAKSFANEHRSWSLELLTNYYERTLNYRNSILTGKKVLPNPQYTLRKIEGELATMEARIAELQAGAEPEPLVDSNTAPVSLTPSTERANMAPNKQAGAPAAQPSNLARLMLSEINAAKGVERLKRLGVRIALRKSELTPEEVNTLKAAYSEKQKQLSLTSTSSSSSSVNTKTARPSRTVRVMLTTINRAGSLKRLKQVGERIELRKSELTPEEVNTLRAAYSKKQKQLSPKQAAKPVNMAPDAKGTVATSSIPQPATKRANIIPDARAAAEQTRNKNPKGSKLYPRAPKDASASDLIKHYTVGEGSKYQGRSIPPETTARRIRENHPEKQQELFDEAKRRYPDENIPSASRAILILADAERLSTLTPEQRAADDKASDALLDTILAATDKKQAAQDIKKLKKLYPSKFGWINEAEAHYDGLKDTTNEADQGQLFGETPPTERSWKLGNVRATGLFSSLSNEKLTNLNNLWQRVWPTKSKKPEGIRAARRLSSSELLTAIKQYPDLLQTLRELTVDGELDSIDAKQLQSILREYEAGLETRAVSYQRRSTEQSLGNALYEDEEISSEGDSDEGLELGYSSSGSLLRKVFSNTTAANLDALNAKSNKIEGNLVFVESEDQLYKFTNGSWVAEKQLVDIQIGNRNAKLGEPGFYLSKAEAESRAANILGEAPNIGVVVRKEERPEILAKIPKKKDRYGKELPANVYFLELDPQSIDDTGFNTKNSEAQTLSDFVNERISNSIARVKTYLGGMTGTPAANYEDSRVIRLKRVLVKRPIKETKNDDGSITFSVVPGGKEEVVRTEEVKVLASDVSRLGRDFLSNFESDTARITSEDSLYDRALVEFLAGLSVLGDALIGIPKGGSSNGANFHYFGLADEYLVDNRGVLLNPKLELNRINGRGLTYKQIVGKYPITDEWIELNRQSNEVRQRMADLVSEIESLYALIDNASSVPQASQQSRESTENKDVDIEKLLSEWSNDEAEYNRLSNDFRQFRAKLQSAINELKEKLAAYEKNSQSPYPKTSGLAGTMELDYESLSDQKYRLIKKAFDSINAEIGRRKAVVEKVRAKLENYAATEVSKPQWSYFLSDKAKQNILGLINQLEATRGQLRSTLKDITMGYGKLSLKKDRVKDAFVKTVTSKARQDIKRVERIKEEIKDDESRLERYFDTINRFRKDISELETKAADLEGAQLEVITNQIAELDKRIANGQVEATRLEYKIISAKAALEGQGLEAYLQEYGDTLTFDDAVLFKGKLDASRERDNKIFKEIENALENLRKKNTSERPIEESMGQDGPKDVARLSASTPAKADKKPRVTVYLYPKKRQENMRVGAARMQNAEEEGMRTVLTKFAEMFNIPDSFTVMSDTEWLGDSIRKDLGAEVEIDFLEKADAHRRSNPKSRGFVYRYGNRAYIYINSKGTTPSTRLQVLAHELGHVITRHYFDQLPVGLQNMLRQAHAAAGQEADFDEWMANQFAKWATTAQQPKNILEGFFKKIGQKLKELYELVKYGLNQTFKEFMDGVAAANNPIKARDGVGVANPFFDYLNVTSAERPPAITQIFGDGKISQENGLLTPRPIESEVTRTAILAQIKQKFPTAYVVFNEETKLFEVGIPPVSNAGQILGYTIPADGSKLKPVADAVKHWNGKLKGKYRWYNVLNEGAMSLGDKLLFRSSAVIKRMKIAAFDELRNKLHLDPGELGVNASGDVDSMTMQNRKIRDLRTLFNELEENLKPLNELKEKNKRRVSADLSIAWHESFGNTDTAKTFTEMNNVLKAYAQSMGLKWNAQDGWFPVALNWSVIEKERPQLIEDFVNYYVDVEKMQRGDAIERARRILTQIDQTPINMPVETTAWKGWEKFVSPELTSTLDGIVLSNEEKLILAKRRALSKSPELAYQQVIRKLVDLGNFNYYFGDLDWDRSDPNAQPDYGKALRRIMTKARDEGATDEQMKYAWDFLAVSMGRYKLIENMSLNTINDAALLYASMRTLTFTVLASFPDLTTTLFRYADTGIWWGGIRSNLLKSLRGHGEGIEMLRDMGMIQETSQEYFAWEMLQYEPAKLTKKLTYGFYKAIQMERWTNAMRAISANMGKSYLLKHAKNYNTDANSKRYLDELGVSPEDIAFWAESKFAFYGKNGFSNEALAMGKSQHSQADIDKISRVTSAMTRLIEETSLHASNTDKPFWMNDPKLKLLAHLKSFMYAYYQKVIKRAVYEMAMRKGIPPAYIAAMVFGIGLSAFGLELRDLLQYKIWGKKSWLDKMSGEQYVKETILRTGILGPAQLFVDMSAAADRGRAPVLALLGPSLTWLNDLYEYPTYKTLPSSIPVVSQIPVIRDPIRDWWKETLY